MALDKEINLQQVLKRFPPGDRWTPVDAEEPIFSSLTEGIEWVFQTTKSRDYLVKAGDGKVFIYTEEDKPLPEPEPPKTYNRHILDIGIIFIIIMGLLIFILGGIIINLFPLITTRHILMSMCIVITDIMYINIEVIY